MSFFSLSLLTLPLGKSLYYKLIYNFFLLSKEMRITMKINEVMKRTGLSRTAIYVYEEQGLLSPVKGEQGYRDYSVKDVEQLLLVAKLRELDIPLNDIAQLLHAPEETDILMQKHLTQMQKRLEETMRKLSQMRTILYNLPPNGQLDDFIKATEIAIPDEMAIASARYLSEDPTLSSARRLTMYMNEAFLDMPLDTPERWDAWYKLLDQMDRVSPQIWDGYEACYGSMTVEQKYKDYRLRRALVVGYTKFTPEDEEKKGEEIISNLGRLLSDPDYLERWRRYYQLVVAPSSRKDSVVNPEELLVVLSTVYFSYNSEFNKIMDTLVYPYFQTEPGRRLCGQLKEVLRDDHDLSPLAMIYFDFWNNTLEKLMA